MYNRHMRAYACMHVLGVFDILRVQYLGIDIASILRAPTPCWSGHVVPSQGMQLWYRSV